MSDNIGEEERWEELQQLREEIERLKAELASVKITLDGTERGYREQSVCLNGERDACRHLIGAANNETLYEAIARLQDHAQGIADHWRSIVAEHVFKEVRLESEAEELRIWKEQMISVMPPMQEIGELLGMTLGSSIHIQIVPKIKELQEKLDTANRDAAGMRDVLQNYYIDNCRICGGKGYYVEGSQEDPEQVQCRECYGARGVLSSPTNKGYFSQEEVKGLVDVCEKMLQDVLHHDVPHSCWSTGPYYGDARDSLCVACDAQKRIRFALAAFTKERGKNESI